MTSLSLSTLALSRGTVAPFRGEDGSAFAKRPVAGPVRITRLGLFGDEQADRVHHGGPDKAVHLYPHEHYSWWQEHLGGHALLEMPGAFGENVTSLGAVETEMCLGDRFALGGAVLEISQGRQPCWKIDHRFERKGMTAAIIGNGRCGVYLRVLEEGEAQAGDEMRLIDRPLPQWSVARLFHLLVGGGAKGDPEGVGELAQLEVLGEAWRTRAMQMAL